MNDELLSHAIDFRNVGAALEERARYHLLVGKSDARRGQRQERRRAARDETDQQIVRAKPLDAIEQTLRRGATSGVGNGVTRLDDFDAVTRYGAPVAGDDHALESGRPMILKGFRHSGGRLASSHHAGPPFGQRAKSNPAPAKQAPGLGTKFSLCQYVRGQRLWFGRHLRQSVRNSSGQSADPTGPFCC